MTSNTVSQLTNLLLLLALATSANARSYTTNFDLAENPLSEGGTWVNVGLDWTAVRTSGGIAYGTHMATGYDDSYAHLSGFTADQSIQGTIYKDPTFTFTQNQEIELHLRWADSAHVARGYEILWEARNSYGIRIMRWNGSLGSFSEVKWFQPGRAPVSGDVLKAQIVRNVITVYLNGTLIGTHDLTGSSPLWTDGNPGIGFFSRDPTGAQNSRFGLSSITASDYPIDPTVRPNPPTNVAVN